ncbi:MAG TPA: nuclear transport factor 2 family protein [Baekduia sp.]|nr:nuclear transport factor 2 family protein [Baekduia sp.]
MNAVERLWRAIRKGDWDAALAQLHEHAVVRWPHSGDRFDRAIDYVTAHRLHGGRTRIDIRGVVAEGKQVTVWVVIEDEQGTWHLGGFYELRDGRIAQGVEIQAREGDYPRIAG